MAYEFFQTLLTEVGSNLLIALVLLLVGIVAGKLVGLIVKKLLEAIRIREGIENIGGDSTFLGIDLVEFTRIFAEWYTYLYFLLAAVTALNVPSLGMFIEEIKAFGLLVLEAIIITYLGLQVAGYVRKSLELYSKHPTIGVVSHYFLIYLTAILALTVVYPQAAQLLNYLLLILVASAGVGIGVGVAIAIGLGSKDVVAKALNTYVAGMPKKRAKTAKRRR
jgi:hypothetical protein